MFIKNRLTHYLILILYISFGTDAYCQSRMEYGVGLKLSYSMADSDIEIFSQGALMPGTFIRAAYKFTPKFKIITEPAITREGYQNSDEIPLKIRSTLLDIPLRIEYLIYKKLGLSIGTKYQRILGFSATRREFVALSESAVDTKNQLGMTLGISLGIGKLFELGIGYSQTFTSILSVQLTDINGNNIGTNQIRNKNFNFSITARY